MTSRASTHCWVGLNPRPSNFSNFSDPVPSYLSALKDQSMIPSLSWAYTAGNQYRLNMVLGSLTLGGYDRSKLEPKSVIVAFNDQVGILLCIVYCRETKVI